MPPSDTPASSHRMPRNLLLALFASMATAIFMIGILVSEGSFKVTKLKPYAGEVVLYSDAVWNTPSGEAVQGLVSYDPASGKVSYLIPPTSPNATVVTPATYFDKHALVIEHNASTTGLVSLDLKTQTGTTVASLSDGFFGQMLWSADGSRIAYVVHAKTGAPSLKITGPDAATDIAFAQPRAFSPDAKELIVDTRPLLSAVDVTTGKRTTLAGLAFTSQNEMIFITPTGDYIVVQQKGEQLARIYHIDWTAHVINFVTPMPIEEGSTLVFDREDRMLVTTKDGLSSKAYQLMPAGNPTLIGLYKFKLPENVHIISWNTP